MRSFKRLTAASLLYSLFPVLCGTAFGQAPVWKARTHKQYERYDMPPAYIYRLDTSRRMISPYGIFVSYQVNVDANGDNIVGDAANECTISVDPTDGNKMAIGWRQFNSVLSNFRQGGYGYTTDFGVHWTFPGVLQNNVFRSDPVTNSDEMGTFFYLSLMQDFCENMYRSTNGGQSWTELQPDGLAEGGDKQWFTIDKTNGPGHGFQYQSSDGSNCERQRRAIPTFHRRRSHLAGAYCYSSSRPQMEHWTWTPMGISLSAEKDSVLLLRSLEQCTDRGTDTNLRPGNGG